MNNPDIHNIVNSPLKKFLGPNDPPRMLSKDFLKDSEFYILKRFQSVFKHFAPYVDITVPSNIENYHIGVIHKNNIFPKGGLLVFRFEDKRSIPVAGLDSGVSFCLPEYRRIGLGREIIYWSFIYGLKTVDDFVEYSPTGLLTRKSVHRFAVQKAINDGFVLDDDILKDYPDLKISRLLLDDKPSAKMGKTL